MGNHNSGRKRKSYSTEKGKELLAKADPESAGVIIAAMKGERVSELQFKAATTIYVHNHGQPKQGHEVTGEIKTYHVVEE